MAHEAISVIIPVYNGESYVKNCIESLLAQTYQNFKMYIVDDGSTDSTLVVLDNYKNHPKIEVITQKNRGVSAARNKGLEFVQGDYISFVDIDDIVAPDYFESLLSPFLTSEITLSICSYTAIDLEKNSKTAPSLAAGKMTQDKAIEYILSERGPQGYLWNKLFLSKQIKENHLHFHSDIFMAEDLLFVVEYLLHGGDIYITDRPLYEYMIYSGSSNKTRLSTLKPGYKKYFENFLLCLDRIIGSLPEELFLSKQAASGRKGRVAIQYLRANNLMVNADKQLTAGLKQIAKHHKRDYFNGLDASKKAKIVYLLTLYVPLLILWRDKKHFLK
ncbi:glycosyltransferase [Streptococcus danieliae]|uniref:Glycosyltransferase n=1 Tax=Streptococcus danieliae TaxID=747656 RepID=A0A7Z0LDB7_9STRE|nr:glycosyltransferase [Streptococcus danieliae]MBF0717251.1 glycosyltransferase [Streptococcus danieliae]NYS49181.1 glycosyltransferase [Streptococcus danieliae]